MTAKPTFEKAMDRLDEIVRELETGELSLEKAMKKFEEGIALSRYCSERLDETERRIVRLMEGADGDIETRPFSDGEAEAG